MPTESTCGNSFKWQDYLVLLIHPLHIFINDQQLTLRENVTAEPRKIILVSTRYISFVKTMRVLRYNLF